jgi:HAMP domain.
MTIKMKLILLGLAGLLSSVLIAGLGLWGMSSNVQTVNSLYNDRVVPLRDLKQIADNYAVNVVDASHKLRNGNISWAEASKNIADAQKLIHDKWDAYLATTLVPEEQALVARIKPLLVTADEKVGQLEAILRQKDMPSLEQFTISQLYPAIDPISEQFAKLIDVQLTVADRDYHQMSSQYQISKWIVIVVLLLSLVLIFSVASSVIKGVINSTTRMSAAMKEAMSGNFKHQIAVSGHDEITSSMHALNALMSSLDQAITEANHVWALLLMRILVSA